MKIFVKTNMWVCAIEAILVVQLAVFCKAQQDDLVVNTTSGPVRGIRAVSKSEKPVNAFLSIPYAEPPLGPLRFKHPEPVKPWTTVLNATTLPLSCPQRLVPIARFNPHLRKQLPTTALHEDCLKLNVWVPVTTARRPFPVLIYFHGGGFSYGSSTTTTHLGDTLASEENVIVASMNYRLSSLGFLFLNHTENPGNAGLYDQMMALEWLASNAAVFGGDPDNVVLVGESAGGTSVLYHILSKKVDHLYNRIVFMSTPVKTGVIMGAEESYRKSLQLAHNAGCPVVESDLTPTINCLREVNADDLLRDEPSDRNYAFLNFFPIVDGDIILDYPNELLRKGHLPKKDLLIGTTKDEGSLFLMVGDPFLFAITSQTAHPSHDDVRRLIREFFTDISDIGLNVLDYHYTGLVDLNDTSKMFRGLVNFLNDYGFVCGANLLADEFAMTGGKVFRYYNTHYPPSSFAPKWFGAYHGSQNIYIFGDLYDFQPKLPASEYQFSRRLMKYVANFARTGNPNQSPAGDESQLIEWPRYSLERKEYMIWAPNSTAAGTKLRETHCAFWNSFMPELARQTGFKLP